MLHIQSTDSFMTIELNEMRKDADDLGYESSSSSNSSFKQKNDECFLDKLMKWCYVREKPKKD